MDFYFPKEMYLDACNYHLCLGDDYYIASIQESIIIGSIQFEEKSGKAKFSSRSLIIPACEYVNFVNVIDKAYRSFQGTGEERPWEILLYSYSRYHHLYARFEMCDGEVTLKLFIKWNFAADVNWNSLVSQGAKKPIDTSKLKDKEWLHLNKRTVQLKKRHLEVINSQLPTILGLSFQQGPDLSGKIMELVNGVMDNEELAEIMENYDDTMYFEYNMNILSQLLDEVYKDQEGQQKKELLFLFTNKVNLIFALLTYYLKR